MASFKQLKNRLSGNPEPKVETKNTTPSDSKKNLPSIPTLEIEEARYLLSLIAKTDFSGKDIQIVYNTALKLQEILQGNLNQENDNG